jgi:hypothetical protein
MNKKNKNIVHTSDTDENLYIRSRHAGYIVETVHPKKTGVSPHLFAMPEAITKGNYGYHRDKEYNLKNMLTKSFIKECESRGLIVTAKYIRLEESRTFENTMIDIAYDSLVHRLPLTIEYK